MGSKIKKKAFTLMEVIIAAIILSIAGLAILQISQKSIHLTSYIDNKSKANELTSIIAYHHKTDYSGLKKSLFDFLKDDYDFKYDKLKNYLKNSELKYEEKLVETIEIEDTQFDIKKAKIIDNKISTSIYFMEF